MKTEKITGLLLIAGTVSLFVPYTLLTLEFDYPSTFSRPFIRAARG
ncbi:MAG: hypothetical protein LH606_20175 [Cytophagaceae bacterium]|nr:hypothetical protein [Cytophagaceae bacterium]